MSADFKKEQLFLYEELEKWQDQYPKYLISLQNQLFDRNGLGGVLPSLAEMIACDADKTVRLLDNMEKIVNRTKQGGIAAIAAKDLTEKTWANYHSSFTAYQKIIKDFIDSPLSSRL